MASIQSVIEIIFNATDNASGAINNLAGGLGKLDAGIQNIAAPFASLADSLIKAEAAALAFGAAVAVLAVRETAQFQDSLYLVNKQLGDSGVTIDEARVKIEKLGLQYGINANEIAKGAAGFLAAGYDYENAASLIETATQLMIAGEVDAATATEALVASISGFRVESENAAAGGLKIAEILNKVADISGGNFEEIVVAFSRVAPAASDANLTMEETAAIVAKMIDTFRSGEIASTAFNSAIATLVNPTKEAREAMTAANIVFQDQNGQLLGTKTILENMAGTWGNLTDQQKQSVAVTVFGTEQYAKLSDLFGGWGKTTEYLNKLLDEQNGAVGSLAKEVQGKLALISSSIDKANESWRQFLENLGAKITDGDQLQGLIGNLGAVGVAFKDVVNQGGFDPLIDLLKSQAGSLSAVAESIAANLPEAFKGLKFDGLIDSLEDLGGTVGDLFKSFFGEIDLTTVDGLTKALQTVMNTFEALTRVVAGIISEFDPLFAAMGETVRHFNALDDASKLEFGQTLGGMKLLVDAGTGLGLALIAIGRAGIEMSTVLDAVFGGAKVAVNALQLGFETLALGVIKTSQVALEAGLALYKLNPFGDDSAIDDAEAKIKALQGTADVVFESMERNAQELRDGWNQATGDATEKTEALRKGLDAGEAALRATGAAAKTVTGELMDWSDGLRQANEGVKTNKEVVKAAEVTLMDWSDGLKDAKATTIAWGDSIKGLPPIKLPEGVEKIEGIFKTAGKEAGNYATAIEGVSTSYTQIGNGTVKATGAFAAVADKTKDAKDQLDALTKGGKLTVDQLTEITKTANEFEAKMEEIASNERIKTIEAFVSLNTAQLETDMERVKSAFASIDSTVQSTGDLLGSLFGNLTGTEDRYKELAIQEQIDLENKRRQEALDIQKKLAEAEIERIEAQAAALNRGDALIRVEGEGLKPELEAFMWKILESIRVRANAEFSDYLLGMGA